MAFRKTVPLQKWQKLDDGGLSFEACFSSDKIDKQGEVIPQPVTQAAVERWAAKNLREMHKDEAVGKALDFNYAEDGTSWLKGFVTSGAPLTVKKVEDGVLQMLSVGGTVKKQHKEVRNGRTVTVIDDFDLHEISLVDAGANPDAWISIAKAAGLEKALPPPKEGEEEEEEEGTEKPEGEEEKPEETMPKEGDDGKPPAKPAEDEAKPVEAGAGLSDEQMAKIVDAVLTALQANAVAAPAKETAKVDAPAAPEIKKTDGMAAYDVRSALDCLSCMEMVRANEKYEVMAGEPEPPEQLKDLDTAIAAWKRFIASESQELLEGAKPSADAMATEKMQKFITDATFTKAEVSAMKASLDAFRAELKAIPQADPRLDALAAIEPISKAIEDLKADIGEVAAIRKSMGFLAEVKRGLDQILSWPIPGNTPLRLVTQGALSKSDSTTATRIDALKSAAVGAPSQVREYLLREASAIERTYPNG